jgi:hypothetical protein
MDAVAPTHRPASRAAAEDEAQVLRRFIEAIESGELIATTLQDVAVVRRLQGALTALEGVTGDSGSGEGWAE